MWVFGYGSLVWKADFPYERRVIGYIKGYVRRFWQASEDHRGIPGKPGRVVTIIPSTQEDQVWGVAYNIAETNREFVTNHLDMRESHGYERVRVTFFPSDPEVDPSLQTPFDLTIYVGNENSQWFAGAADIEVIAAQIVNSEGPSGTNSEYLYKLASAMRMVAPSVHDEHLFCLEKAVRRLENERDSSLRSQNSV